MISPKKVVELDYSQAKFSRIPFGVGAAGLVKEGMADRRNAMVKQYNQARSDAK